MDRIKEIIKAKIKETHKWENTSGWCSLCNAENYCKHKIKREALQDLLNELNKNQ